MFRNLKDPVSGLTHLAGALLGAGGLVYLVNRSLEMGSRSHLVAVSVFGVSLVLLYLSSASYHLFNVSDEARRIFRTLDHAMIFVLIAGSYTPYCLIALRGPLGWSVLAMVWTIALGGLIMKIFWLHSPRWLSTGLYLTMGWVIVGVIVPLSRALNAEAFWWLVVGGICYSVGAVIYAIKRPDPFPNVFGFHEIWHLFVLAGSASHFVSIASL